MSEVDGEAVAIEHGRRDSQLVWAGPPADSSLDCNNLCDSGNLRSRIATRRRSAFLPAGATGPLQHPSAAQCQSLQRPAYLRRATRAQGLGFSQFVSGFPPIMHEGGMGHPPRATNDLIDRNDGGVQEASWH